MKIYHLAILFVSLFTGLITQKSHSQEKPGLPVRVTELEMIYNREIVKATKQLNSKYLPALEALQIRYTQAKNFEAALQVKKEIELITAYQNRQFQTEKQEIKLPPIGAKKEKPKYKDPEGLLKWEGDGVPNILGDTVTSVVLKARRTKDVVISQMISTERATEGKLTFRYMSSDYEGKGLEFRGVYSTQAFKFRNPTVVFDGKWNTYVWPFNDIRNEKAIRFEFRVLPGTGEIHLNQIKAEFK